MSLENQTVIEKDHLQTQQNLIRACQNCRSDESLEEHHIVPLRDGGNDIPTNTTTLCERCHQAIHTNKKAPTAEQKNHNLGEFGVKPNEGERSEIDRNIWRSQKKLNEFGVKPNEGERFEVDRNVRRSQKKLTEF